MLQREALCHDTHQCDYAEIINPFQLLSQGSLVHTLPAVLKSGWNAEEQTRPQDEGKGSLDPKHGALTNMS